MAPDKSSRRSPSPPIPSYDEATSATNPLLGGYDGSSSSGHHTAYQQPRAQSVRSSEDSLYASRQPFDGPHVLTSDSDTDSETSEGLRRDLDDLDYHADDVELEELENGTVRRRRRQHGSWKGTLFGLRKRVGKWRHLWSFRFPHWASSPFASWSWPAVPEAWKVTGAVIARLIGLFVLISLGYALFALAIFPASQNELASLFDPEGVRQVAQSSVDPNRIKSYLQHITSFDHIAGTKGSFYLAEWIKDLMVNSGFDGVKLEEYDVYLNYAKKDGRKVAIIQPEELRWQATLEEEPLYPGRTDRKSNTPVFHGHSKSGTVSGPLIYFNYGSQADYKRVCEDSGINCNGAIALVREYGTPGDRGSKVKAAEKWGISGVLIYSDPADDGFKKGPVWPDGPWRPADSVQRGSVSLMNLVLGDPLTPGWPSSKDEKRLSKGNNKGLVNIPSLPLAWRDAQKLLQSLKGHGWKLQDNWHGGVPDVEWWSGNDSSPKVLLQNEQDEKDQQRIFNVLGRIDGIEPDRKDIIVGNHRDSWCFGAADPGSGTAVMLEVMQILGKLKAQGWRPLRSIIFASWDAAEYNLMGSTEWVEDNLHELRRSAVAYINVGAAVSGTKFEASASPLYKRALQRVLGRVSDPTQNKTFGQIWEEQGSDLKGLGSGGDYVAFQDLAGTSSIDMGFRGDALPYHSCYDTYEWMERFGDPDFSYHKALAEIWVLLILELSQEMLVPFNFHDYSSSLTTQLEKLTTYSETRGAPMPNEQGKGGFDMTAMYDAARSLKKSAHDLDEWENWWRGQVMGSGGLETNALAAQRMAYNSKLSDFETDLLDISRTENKNGPFGVPGREQFKHVVFGPQEWSGYGESYFPFIRDAIDAKDWEFAQTQVEKTARIISAASEKLRAK